MENCTNSTNCSILASNDLPPTDSVLGTLAVFLFGVIVATSALNIITITALCAAHSVVRLVRIFLINTLVAGLVASLSALSLGFFPIILTFTSAPPPPLEFCRFVSYGLVVGSIARLYSLTAFSVIVLLIVKYNVRIIRNVYIVLSLLFVWVVPLLVNLHSLIPDIFAFHYYENIACYPKTLDADIIKEARYTFTGIWIVFGSLTPLIITIVIPIVVLCYVRHNTIAEGSSYKKGMAKFALFLVLGNFFNVVVQVSIAATSYYSEKVAIYLTFITNTVFLIPTPVLVILFLKSVRNGLRYIFCSCCLSSLPVYAVKKAFHV